MNRIAHLQVRSSEDGLRLFFLYTFWIMAAGLALTAIVAMYVQSNEALFASMTYVTETVNSDGETVKTFGASGLWWLAAGLELVLVIVLASFGLSARINLPTAVSLFAVYAGLNGFTLAPVLYMYTDASVAKVFFV